MVEFKCPVVRELKPIDLTDPGLIKRIRGNAYCTKVSPQIANRVAESSRGAFLLLFYNLVITFTCMFDCYTKLHKFFCRRRSRQAGFMGDVFLFIYPQP